MLERSGGALTYTQYEKYWNMIKKAPSPIRYHLGCMVGLTEGTFHHYGTLLANKSIRLLLGEWLRCAIGLRQGPPCGGVVGPQGGGTSCAADRQHVPPKMSAVHGFFDLHGDGHRGAVSCALAIFWLWAMGNGWR
jgi:hypothetical protein